MFDLTGKNALVTGATGGIGGAIAEALVKAGATVTLTGRRETLLQERVNELGGNAHVAAGDLSDPEQLDSVVKTATEKMGSIDILVNNAGLTRDTLAMRMKPEDWQQVLDVNLTSSFRLSQAVMKGMMKARWGRIISITSIVGVTGNPGQTNYAASKAGLIGMSKSLAQEVASRGITVNCVAPGFIETAMTDALTDDQKTAITKNIPAASLGRSEDIAAAVAYLASTEAGYVTGQTLHVNGGMAMI